MREEAARVALDWATDRAGQGFPGHEDMAQMGDAIRALPLAPVEATPPATDPLPLDPKPWREGGYEHTRVASRCSCGCNQFAPREGYSQNREDYPGFTPRSEFGPTRREGENK